MNKNFKKKSLCNLKFGGIVFLLSATTMQSCSKLLLKEPFAKNDILEIRMFDKGKSISGTFSDREKKAFTSLTVTSLSCDSFFLTKQQPEPLPHNLQKLRSFAITYLIVFEKDSAIKATENEIALFEKVIAKSKEHFNCSNWPKDFSLYRIARTGLKRRL